MIRSRGGQKGVGEGRQEQGTHDQEQGRQKQGRATGVAEDKQEQ